MAIAFVAAGTVANGTGAVSPGLPAGTLPGHILVMVCESNLNEAVTAAGWIQAPNSPQQLTSTRLTILWRRATGSDATTTNDPGNHIVAQILGFSGCIGTGSPWNITAGATDTSDTSGSIPAATTTVTDSMVVLACSTTRDAIGTAEFSAFTNANLGALTERIDQVVDDGDGGGIGAATGTWATTGSYGATTVTYANASVKGLWSGALTPAVYGRPIADDAAGSWTTAPLFSKVDEVDPDAADFIESETLVAAGNTTDADLSITSLTDPTNSYGHVLRVQAKATFTLGAAASLKAELRQGATLIATLTATLTTSYVTYTYDLSSGQADAITDYTDLFVRLYGVFGSGNLGSVQVSWAEFEIPPAGATVSATATATLSGAGDVYASGSIPTDLDLIDGAAPTSPDVLPLVQISVSVPNATPAGQPTIYEVRAVTSAGVVQAVYPKIECDTIEWVKNAPGSAKFRIALDVDVTELDAPNEVQIWRNGAILWWGIVTGKEVDSGKREWVFDADGLLWYFQRRYIGDANRADRLEEVGNFEGTDLDQWTIGYGFLGGSGLTKSVESTVKILDAQSAKLVGDSANGDRYIYRQVTVTSTDIGVVLFLVAWVYVETMTEPGNSSRGAMIGYFDDPADAFFADYHYAVLNFSTPTGSWQRLETELFIPAGEARLVEVRLHCPVGTVYWDAVTLTAMESFSLIAANAANGLGWDQVDIVSMLFDYGQGLGPFAYLNPQTDAKSNLNMGTIGDPSGVIKQRTYQFFDHQRIYSGGRGAGVVDEFLKSSDGVDVEVRYNATARWVQIFYPHVGTDRNTWRFRWEGRTNPDGTFTGERWGIVGWQFGESIAETANQVVVLGGWGRGAGREEGGYSNPAALGGLTLEHVETAPQDAPLDALDAIAENRGAQLENAVQTPRISIAEPKDANGATVTQFIGVLMPGDRIPIVLTDGAFQMLGTFEVASVQLNGRDDTLEIVPNPAEFLEE